MNFFRIKFFCRLRFTRSWHSATEATGEQGGEHDSRVSYLILYLKKTYLIYLISETWEEMRKSFYWESEPYNKCINLFFLGI